jgi:hypothetical protein
VKYHVITGAQANTGTWDLVNIEAATLTTWPWYSVLLQCLFLASSLQNRCYTVHHLTYLQGSSSFHSLVYLTKLVQLLKCDFEDELLKMWKAICMAYFKVPLLHFPRGIWKRTTKNSGDIKLLDQEWNLEPPSHEGGVLCS